MKVSQRIQDLAESGTIAVSNRVAALRAEGVDVVSLGDGEPDFDTPDHIKQAASAALDRGETKYAKPASGVAELKSAVIDKLARENNLTYAPDQIIATIGGKEGLYLAFATLLDPGDEVIIPTPYWVSYPEQIKLVGGVPVFIDAGAASGFKITPEQLRAAITPRTRAFVFNSPSNPTGAAYSPEETDALAAVLADTDVITLSDEMYDRLLFGGQEFKSFAATSTHAYDHTLTFNAGSKTFSMTGWRIGYAAGPVDLIKGMSKLQTQTTSGAATFTMHAMAAALNGDQTCVDEMRDAFESRGRFISEALNRLEGVVCPAPGGAFYVFPDVSDTFASLDVSGSTAWAGRLLEEAHVGVVPGSDFGNDACVRLSFATSMDTLEEAMRRIEAFLD